MEVKVFKGPMFSKNEALVHKKIAGYIKDQIKVEQNVPRRKASV